MQNNFETLIGSFINENIGIDNHFLSDDLANHLKDNLLALASNNKLLVASTGHDTSLKQDSLVRNDLIYWLDREHDNEYENDFLDQIDDFIKYLNRSCFAGIKSYEFHYSLYEIGSFYKKHIDQFNNNPNRKYSMISYLNQDWEEADGGQLKVYQNYNDKKINPSMGKTVFFKSNELAHEVLITNKNRMSITGWLKTD